MFPRLALQMHSPEFTSSLLSKLTFWWINP